MVIPTGIKLSYLWGNCTIKQVHQVSGTCAIHMTACDTGRVAKSTYIQSNGNYWYLKWVCLITFSMNGLFTYIIIKSNYSIRPNNEAVTIAIYFYVYSLM